MKIFYCGECGNAQGAQAELWVDLNTQEQIGEGGGGQGFCPKCDSIADIEEREATPVECVELLRQRRLVALRFLKAQAPHVFMMLPEDVRLDAEEGT